MLRERADAIRAWMKPATPDAIVKSVAALAPVMKQRNWDEKTSTAILRTYAMDLAEQPLFAVQEACAAYRRCEVGDGWMPMPGELLRESIQRAGRLRAEAIEIGRVLGATVVDEKPEAERAVNRERAASILSRLRKELEAARPRNERRPAREIVAEPVLSPDEVLARTTQLYRENPVRIEPSLLPARAA